MPTIDQLKQYLQSMGIPLPPDFVLNAWLAQVGSIEACLVGAGYDAGTKTMIYLYLLALFGLSSGDRYISSQSAPSGASQSFRYKADGLQMRNIRGLLLNLDKSGCAADLIPPDDGPNAGLWVTRSDCCK